MTTSPAAWFASRAALSKLAPDASASDIVAITVSPAPVTSAISSEPTIGMCTVGAPLTNSAMPRLPRVMSTACIAVGVRHLAPGALEHRRSSLMRIPSACSTSDSLGVHAVRPRYFSS
jgi:hypothetical protein